MDAIQAMRFPRLISPAPVATPMRVTSGAHENEYRQHKGDASDRLGAETADPVCLQDRNEGLCSDHGDYGKGELE